MLLRRCQGRRPHCWRRWQRLRTQHWVQVQVPYPTQAQGREQGQEQEQERERWQKMPSL